jgi:ABC-type lipoprotein export system ATPase subunit/ABC-type transporter Mla maintaining outer membrane lipid asymmetry permease subunit MlaE
VSQRLHLALDCRWNAQILPSERCGVLLQQTTLIDELTVASNLGLALQNEQGYSSRQDRDNRIAELLTLVGLNASQDGAKRPHQLSGGMGRRASLSLQLAQHKHAIVLDEPFTGLDEESALSVVSALVNLRQRHQTALVLISHQPHLVELVMNPQTTKDNQVIHLTEPPLTHSKHVKGDPLAIHGISWNDRFLERLWDYCVYSLPLIVLAFCATGMALSMLTADVLQRLDVTDPVINMVDQEVRPLIQMLTGEVPNAFTMMGVRMKVRGMLNATIPTAKATLYALGMTRLLVLELGPLLTALLLCGRLGGSYAGRVATLLATRQDALLQTLGVSPRQWTLGPSLGAASLAGPILTVVGTAVALALAAWMGRIYGLLSLSDFGHHARQTIFPPLRIRLVESWVTLNANAQECVLSQEAASVAGEVTTSTCTIIATEAWWTRIVWDMRPTFSESYVDTLVEMFTHPAIFHWVKAQFLSLLIVVTADLCARRPGLTPREVPAVITAAVVVAGLLVLMADWAFSQLWLLRETEDWNLELRSGVVSGLLN